MRPNNVSDIVVLRALSGSRRFLLFFVLCISTMSQLFSSPAITQAQQSDDSAAKQMLTLLNAWRVDQSLWPLKVNKVLETMALSQAVYVAPKLASFQDESDYHRDAKGNLPQQRAVLAPYNWPHYRNVNQIEIGENAAVGTAQFAINFWKGSDIHRRAALSTVYREVGIAAIPTAQGELFIVDFGARPGILTVLANGPGNMLYLSDEHSTYAGLPSTGTQVRLFDAQGTALTDTLPWTPTLAVPQGSSGNLLVLFTNGSFQALSAVNVASDMAVLPGVQVAANPTATAQPDVQATVQPTAQVAIAPTAAAGASSTPTNFPIVLIYNRRALTLYNNSGTALDLSGFSVGGGAGRVTVESWLKVAPIPAGAFPPRDCLQIQILNVPPDAPSSCRMVRAQITLPAANVFWTKGIFEVKQGTASLAICKADAGRCDIDWPKNQR